MRLSLLRSLQQTATRWLDLTFTTWCALHHDNMHVNCQGDEFFYQSYMILSVNLIGVYFREYKINAIELKGRQRRTPPVAVSLMPH